MSSLYFKTSSFKLLTKWWNFLRKCWRSLFMWTDVLHFEWLFLPICQTKILSHELFFPSGNIHIIKRSIKFKIFIHNHHTRACSWISGELISYVMKSCASFAFPHLLHRAAPLILLHNFCLKFVDLEPNPRTHLISVEITCCAQGRQSELWWCCVSPGAHFPGYSNTAAAPMPVPMHMDTTPYALKQTTCATKEKEQDSSGLHHPGEK